MSLPPQSILLAREHIPHFVNQVSRNKVLTCYKSIHRNLLHITEPWLRKCLKRMVQHNFARYKFVTQTDKVYALLDYAQINEIKWIYGAVAGNHKDMNKLLHFFAETQGVKYCSIKKLLFDPPAELISEKQTLHFQLNNIRNPSERLFEEYDAMFKHCMETPILKINHPYWQLVKLLRSYNINLGKNQRKVVFQYTDMGVRTLSVLGQPLPRSRQLNILKMLYDKFLRDSPKPVHPAVLEYFKEQGENMHHPRSLRRRYKEISKEIFSIDENGKILKVV